MQGAQRLYPELGPYLDYSVMSVSKYLVSDSEDVQND